MTPEPVSYAEFVAHVDEAVARLEAVHANAPRPALWRAALRTSIWFVLSGVSLWALGCDPITAARYAFVPWFVASGVATSGALVVLALFYLAKSFAVDSVEAERSAAALRRLEELKAQLAELRRRAGMGEK